MTIKREINGVMMEISLTKSDVQAAYEEQQALYDLEDAYDAIANDRDDNSMYSDEFYDYALSNQDVAKQIAKVFRDCYTWTDSGYEQMLVATRSVLAVEHKAWLESHTSDTVSKQETSVTEKDKPYAEYRITMKQEDEDCFHELRTALERASFSVNDWYEEDGIIHLNDVFTTDANSSNYLLTLIRCYATMNNVRIAVMERLSGTWTPQKIIFNGGVMERYISHITYTKI